MPATFRSSFAVLLFLLASMSLAQMLPPGGPPYRVDGNVTRPEKISGSPPLYTEAARKARVTGTVIVEAIIDEQGDVTNVRVLQGLPLGLDESTVEAVKTWKFKPATLDGRPVKVYYTLTVNFTVKDEAPDPRALRLVGELLQQYPRLEALMQGGRYEEALDLLDAEAASPRVHLARSLVLAGLRRFDEALEEARAYDGPEPDVVFHLVALGALNAISRPSLDEKTRAGILDVGLQAATQAMEAGKDFKGAMLTRSRLLRAKAALAVDPQRAALLYEADELEKRAAISPP